MSLCYLSVPVAVLGEHNIAGILAKYTVISFLLARFCSPVPVQDWPAQKQLYVSIPYIWHLAYSASSTRSTTACHSAAHFAVPLCAGVHKLSFPRAAEIKGAPKADRFVPSLYSLHGMLTVEKKSFAQMAMDTRSIICACET
ncbi:hypothetical protein MTO96_018085 [Rhipicephalus appendiculatus]